MEKAIKIWRPEDAPPDYSILSEDDDVSWIAFIPDDVLKREYGLIPFLEEGGSFGCAAVERYKVEGGEVWFGCHS